MMKLGNQKGFTMLELMTAVGISVFIGSSLYLAAQTGETQTRASELKMTIQDGAREGLYKMMQEVRESAPSKVTVGSSGTSLTFYIPDPTTSVTSAYAVNWTSYSIQYSLSSSQVIRSYTTGGTTTNTVMADNVTALTFSITSSNIVNITMSVQKQLSNGRNIPATALQLNGQAELRNS